MQTFNHGRVLVDLSREAIPQAGSRSFGWGAAFTPLQLSPACTHYPVFMRSSSRGWLDRIVANLIWPQKNVGNDKAEGPGTDV